MKEPKKDIATTSASARGALPHGNALYTENLYFELEKLNALDAQMQMQLHESGARNQKKKKKAGAQSAKGGIVEAEEEVICTARLQLLQYHCNPIRKH